MHGQTSRTRLGRQRKQTYFEAVTVDLADWTSLSI